MTINQLCLKAHRAAVEKGWYERPRELPELLMLIVSELSEAMEADREGRKCIQEDVYELGLPEYIWDKETIDYFRDEIKDTVEDEIADAFIRLADLCGHLNIDIEAHIAAKMAYNETRPRKHGKAY